VAALPPSIVPTQLLIRAMQRAIEDSVAGGIHLVETKQFLEAIREHLVWYDRLLQQVQGHVADPETVEGAINQIGSMVCEVVSYLRGMCEGTSDRIPFTFAPLLQRELKAATGKRQDIALFPLDEFNYFYIDVVEKVFTKAFGELSRPAESFMQLFGPARRRGRT